MKKTKIRRGVEVDISRHFFVSAVGKTTQDMMYAIYVELNVSGNKEFSLLLFRQFFEK